MKNYIKCTSHFRALHSKGGFIWELFKHGKNGSIYQKIYKNNMNQLDSVVKTELRIAKLINTHKVAMIGSDAIFKKYKKYECKVLSIFFHKP